MNFYKHYIGDYQRDTGHLSLAEHGAYRLMLDTYYATEKPLPVDRKALYRLLRAETPTERKAIDSIVSQFWTVSKGGMINLRATTEIGKADKQAEINRQIALVREEKKRQRKAETSDVENDKVYKVFDMNEGLYLAHSPVNEGVFCGFDEEGVVHDLNKAYKVFCKYGTGRDDKVQEKKSTVRDTAVKTNEGTDDQVNAPEPGATKDGVLGMGSATGMDEAITITNDEPNHSHSHSQTLKGDGAIKKRAQGEGEGDGMVYTAAELSKVMREVGIDAQPADPRIMALAAQGVSLLTMRAASEEAKRAKPDERIGSGYVVKIVERWAKEAASMKVRGARPVGASRGSGVFSERKRVLDGLTGHAREVGMVVEVVDGVRADISVDAACRMIEREKLPIADLQAINMVTNTAAINMDAENG